MKDKNDVINTENIMKKISSDVREKKETGPCSDEDTVMSLEAGALRESNYFKSLKNIENYLVDLEELWDPREHSPITSHRKIIGNLIVFPKKAIRKILRMCGVTSVLLTRQAQFNNHALTLLNDLISWLHSELSESYAKSKELSKKVVELKQENILQKRRLDRMLSEMSKKYDLSEEGAANLVKEKNNLMDHNYFQFENLFRGEQKEIKKKQEVYLSIFKDSGNVLDIGCGRGEFLEILKENSIQATGIDLNEDMIYACKEKKLNVKQSDAITYLNSLEDNSLGGILASHVIEHFPPDLLADFLKLSSSKLKKGASIALETPNPLSIIVSAVNFYLDPSHIRPIHPEAIKFLLEVNGFEDVYLKYLSPYPKEVKLQPIVPDQSQEAPVEQFIKTLNNNTEKLNEMLYGYQDYAVIGKK